MVKLLYNIHNNHMPQKNKKKHTTIKTDNGYLHKITPVFDSAGNLVHNAVRSFKIELHLSDVMQIIVGASILSIPVGFTEETWRMGETLVWFNVMLLAAVSILFIGAFVYFRFYRGIMKGFYFEYCKRVMATYFLSLLVVGLLLSIIQKCPWGIDNMLALKRIIIVSFPASMSATLTDALK
jgi:uncharacterized membrane protein